MFNFTFRTFIVYILFFALGFVLTNFIKNGFEIFCVSCLSILIALLNTYDNHN